MNDIEKVIELLKIINKNMKVDHMMKDMWGGATEEETREYTEDFGLINLAISALERQIPKKIDHDYLSCNSCDGDLEVFARMDIVHCPWCGQRLDWSAEE